MSLKNYEVQPDSGLFEKIERRLRLRRLARVSGGVAAACVAVAAVVWVAMPSRDAAAELSPEAVAVAQRPEAAMPQTVAPVAEEQTDATRMAPTRRPIAEMHETVPTYAVEVQKNDAVAVASASVAAAKPAEPAKANAVASPVPAVASPKPVAEPAVASTVVATEQPVAPVVPADKAKDPSSTIVHEDNLMWAPNVIVPNGDVDENRTFKLKFTSAVTDFRIVIFNRGGRQLYQSNDPAFEWDGTHDGTAMPQGAYVWVAKFRDSDGRAHQEKGTVTVLR